EFDADGKLLSHFGGPGQGYQWPQSPGGIAVDAKGNVWIAAAGGHAAPGGARGRAAVDPDAVGPPGGARGATEAARGAEGGAARGAAPGRGRGGAPAGAAGAPVMRLTRAGNV